MTPDYDALVERLGTSPNYLGQTGRDAAQAITTQAAEIERLLEALKKIASCEKRADGDVVDIARAAIKAAKEG